MRRVLNFKIKGFTLFELLVTMGIMILLAAMVIPLVKTFGVGTELKNSAFNISGMLRLARQMSITTNSVYGLYTDLSQDLIYISDKHDIQFDKTYYTPTSVDISVATSSSAVPERIRFLPRGTSDSGTIRVTSRRKNSEGGYNFYEVTITGSAGRIRIKDLNRVD